MKPKFHKNDIWLFACLVFLLTGYFCSVCFQTPVQSKNYQEKILAAKRTQESFSLIKEKRLKQGWIIDKNSDLNETGMIGLRWSGMTTTLGALEAKRTALNPDFSALAVSLLKDCGAKKGDKIALNFSGSFPALNIAVLQAIDVLELNPVAISSLGASMWGANDPNWTYLDMERLLVTEKSLAKGSTAFSLGGADDIGQDMDTNIRQVLQQKLEAFQSEGGTVIHEPELSKNIERRIALYEKGGMPVCFINVGGNLASTGLSTENSKHKHGFIRPNDFANQKIGGLIGHFLSKEIPVIQFLDIKALALATGLPFDPVPLPEPGEGNLYWENTPNKAYLLVLLGIALGLLYGYIRGKRRSMVLPK